MPGDGAPAAHPPQRTSAPITSGARAFQSGNRPPQAATNNPRAVQQLRPQALPGRQSASNILVSNRQHGNPVLKEIKSQGWEYADIPADYVLGATTCALYLSLKYHRLHPHYIYNRIRDLAGKYNLRILLTMVDVTNHEEHLKELSKTSLINNVTLILCWSPAEAGRYLELYKTYEHAPPTMIKAPQSAAHGDRLVEFITTPRSINKTDAMSLVGNFGSIRTAVNAKHEELLLVAGWGQTKVKQWNSAVTEPFRNRRAAKRGVSTTPAITRDASRAEGVETPAGIVNAATVVSSSTSRALPPVTGGLPDADKRPPKRVADDFDLDVDADEEEAMRDLINEERRVPPAVVQAPPGTVIAKPAPRKKPQEPEMDDGVLAALNKFRENG